MIELAPGHSIRIAANRGRGVTVRCMTCDQDVLACTTPSDQVAPDLDLEALEDAIEVHLSEEDNTAPRGFRFGGASAFMDDDTPP